MTTIVPTNPADIEKIRNAVVEANNSKIRIAAENDNIKEIKKKMKDDFQISVADFNKMVNTYSKQNFAEVTAKNEEFEILYETVMVKK